MMVYMSKAADLDLIGGHPALDFVNTLAATVEQPAEFLHDYADLVAWAAHAEVIAPATAGALRELALHHPAEAALTYADALRLRTCLDEILRARLAGDPPEPAVLDGIRDSYLEALRHARLSDQGGRYEWTWPEPAGELAGPLWRLAGEAVDLLHSDLLDRLSTCTDCRWLFLDLSKNRSRRWCRMRGCGARAKMRRYRARSG
jgi:predicted RNA-binding Zn ribbon-like protein